MSNRSLLLLALAVLPACMTPSSGDTTPKTGDGCGWGGCIIEDAPPVAHLPDQAFPAVEPVLGKLAREWADKHEHDVTIKRTYTSQEDWDVERESGVIVGRATSGFVYTWDATNQQCWQLLANVRQDELGGRWGKPYLQLGFAMKVTCESIDALAPRPGA